MGGNAMTSSQVMGGSVPMGGSMPMGGAAPMQPQMGGNAMTSLGGSSMTSQPINPNPLNTSSMTSQPMNPNPMSGFPMMSSPMSAPNLMTPQAAPMTPTTGMGMQSGIITPQSTGTTALVALI